MSENQINPNQSYDEMTYDSYPYLNTSPEKLATLAVLFGLNPPSVNRARVLELGCAAGGNIIPHAVHNPEGQYVGIDLSVKQIAEGQEQIEKLGLKNIQLKQMSIADIDGSFGKFDYIICHGVFSWVPVEIQDKILQISKQNLTENGVAYISYNTLPGWNMVRTIRDMMLYHSKSFSNLKDKVAQSRALLGFIKDSLDGQDTVYAKMLSQEAELLSKQADCYIAHDHLEQENSQFYFSEFMNRANKEGLQYLSDVAINMMYLGNFKPEVADKLKSISDIVQTEQYLDFINNRRFRSTLLCHNHLKVNRALSSEMIRKFTMTANITLSEPLKGKIEEQQEAKFYIRNNKESFLTIKSPYLIAALIILSEHQGFPLSFNTIVTKANKLLKKDCKAEIEKEFENIALNLVIKGILDIGLNERDKEKLDLQKPKVTALVQYQLQNPQRTWVTSSRHIPVSLNIFDKVALQYMNGSRNLEEISELLVQDIKQGKLHMNKGDKKIENSKEIKKELQNILAQSMDKYAAQGIVV
ncbi:MAG: methyltransferase regulatory domain-containing protein [Rickettsiaceae bacterium]|nr:methyltransferase regulatory domain-containing protein [Rickettsiaceae bacterium]